MATLDAVISTTRTSLSMRVTPAASLMSTSPCVAPAECDQAVASLPPPPCDHLLQRLPYQHRECPLSHLPLRSPRHQPPDLPAVSVSAPPAPVLPAPTEVVTAPPAPPVAAPERSTQSQSTQSSTCRAELQQTRCARRARVRTFDRHCTTCGGSAAAAHHEQVATCHLSTHAGCYLKRTTPTACCAAALASRDRHFPASNIVCGRVARRQAERTACIRVTATNRHGHAPPAPPTAVLELILTEPVLPEQRAGAEHE